VEKSETYLMACKPPNPMPKGWTKNKNCISDLTCPGEPGCLGLQCFGSQYLAGQGYDGLMRAYMECCNNFSACKPWWRKWLQPPSKLNGPKLKGSLACPPSRPTRPAANSGSGSRRRSGSETDTVLLQYCTVLYDVGQVPRASAGWVCCAEAFGLDRSEEFARR